MTQKPRNTQSQNHYHLQLTLINKLRAETKDLILWSDLDWTTKDYKEKQPEIPDWRKCKLLGSLLDNNKDIERRKGLTITAINTLNYIFKSKIVCIELKLKSFELGAAMTIAGELKGKLADAELEHALDPANSGKKSKGSRNLNIGKLIAL